MSVLLSSLFQKFKLINFQNDFRRIIWKSNNGKITYPRWILFSESEEGLAEANSLTPLVSTQV